MNFLQKIKNFFYKKKNTELEPKPSPFIQKVYDWVMSLDENDIIVSKSERNSIENIAETYIHIAQRYNLTKDDGCGRRVTVKRVKKSNINQTTGCGFIDISYFLVAIGKWEEELVENDLEFVNIVEDNSGAIKAIFTRGLEIFPKQNFLKKEEKNSEIKDKLQKFIEKF